MRFSLIFRVEKKNEPMIMLFWRWMSQNTYFFVYFFVGLWYLTISESMYMHFRRFFFPMMEASFSWKNLFSRFSYQDNQNVEKRTEKQFRTNFRMRACARAYVCLCMCWDLGKIKLLYLKSYLVDRAEILCAHKIDEALSLISILWKLIHELDFSDNLSF